MVLPLLAGAAGSGATSGAASLLGLSPLSFSATPVSGLSGQFTNTTGNFSFGGQPQMQGAHDLLGGGVSVSASTNLMLMIGTAVLLFAYMRK